MECNGLDCLTTHSAIIAYFVMQDYPDTAKFLTPTEKQEVLRRLEDDRSALAHEFSMKYFWHAVKDWKIWVHSKKNRISPAWYRD